jgi:hypothetical protein
MTIGVRVRLRVRFRVRFRVRVRVRVSRVHMFLRRGLGNRLGMS